MLQEFGTSQFLYREDFDSEDGNLIFVEFRYNTYPVSFKLSVDSIAKTFLEENPWTSRRKCSEAEWVDKAVEQSKPEAMKMLVDHVSAMMDAVMYGGVEFEALFLSYFKLKDGQTVGEKLVGHLPEIMETGNLPLLDGVRKKRRKS